MIGPPKVGYVLRYAYLWKADYDRGREEGSKNRPCVLILSVSAPDDLGRRLVRVLPITHRAPTNSDDAVEIPAATKTRLGLDYDRSWVLLTEGNTFVWPGPDVRLVPRTRPPSIYYGPLPPKLFATIVRRFVALARKRRFQVVSRES